jgi:hypothetical protein
MKEGTVTASTAARWLNVSKSWVYNHSAQLGGRMNESGQWEYPADVRERGINVKVRLGQYHRVVNRCEGCGYEVVSRAGVLSPVYYDYPECVSCAGVA